jgi:hypothetical protein
VRRTPPWAARLTWLAAALLSVPALRGALQSHSDAVRWVAATELWVLWTVALVATLVPRSVSLTVYRTIAPLSLVAAVWAAFDASATAAALAVAASAAATVVACSRVTTDAFVDGSSYGSEQRFGLRTPLFLLIGPVPLAWFVTVVGLAGPLLLAAQQWLAGAVVTVFGLGVARYSTRSLHALARRWVVFVPAGVVLHDPLVLADAILLPRRQIVALGPALADTTATDLTDGAPGLVLEVQLADAVDLGLREGRHAAAEPVTTDRLLFSPLRPGALLDAAANRRVPVG